MRASIDVAIIGAGPYGLSVAAHLAARGIDHRVFGEPMRLWDRHMPPGMHLKSDGKSSDLSDPDGALTLAEFCRTRGIAFDRTLLPVKVETFAAYGRAFQERFAPRTECRHLTRLDRASGVFNLHFDDGEWLTANHVVLAVGVLPFRHVPEMFSHLPPSLASHSSAFGRLDHLDGREVVIVGAGSSALDLAALLTDRSSRVSIVTRSQRLLFHGAPPTRPRSLLWRLRAPDSKIGAGWLLRFCDDAPQLVHALPDALRRRIVRNTLGPSGGYFVRDRVMGSATIHCGRAPLSATARGDRVVLHTQERDGRRDSIEGDHLILATGYRLDVDSLPFLSREIRDGLTTVEKMPILSANFESSIPGLYFVGFAAMRGFGPVMRFVAGAPHPARRLARHIAGLTRPSFSPARLRPVG